MSKSVGLEQLGLSSRVFRYLSARGVRTIDDLLADDAGALVLQATRWEEIADRLAHFADRRPEWKPRIIAYLDAGWQAAHNKREELAERRAADPDAGRSPLERALAQALRQAANPMPLRVIRRQIAPMFPGQPVKIKEIFANTPHFQLYPYGRHNWVGLAEWGQEGYRKAARAAWSILPVHLGALLADGKLETMPADALLAVAQVAQERGDTATQLLCREFVEEPVRAEKVATETSDATEQAMPTPGAAAAVDNKAPEPDPIAELEPETTRVAETTAVYHIPDKPKVAAELRAMLDSFVAKAKPHIFANVDSGGHPKHAVEAILQKVENLDRPFSLAQAGANAYDYVWVKKWARQLPGYVARGYVDNTFREHKIGAGKWSDAECFGTMFLFLASEDARRHAKEGKLWEIVVESFSETTRLELFAGGQPRAETKAALEAGARRLGVHHAFANEGQKRWLLTVFLQFGFTRAGIDTLPLWLSALENMPQACLQLLEESPPFRELWTALRAYRGQDMSAQDLTRALNRCPFVLQEWIEDIVATVPRVSQQDSTNEDDDTPLSSLLEPAKLSWQGATPPFWAAKFRPLGSMQLTGDVYEVEVNGSPKAQILRQSDEHGEVLVAEPGSLELPLSRRNVEVRLLDEAGEDDRDLSYEVWDGIGDVAIYEASSGKRVSERETLLLKRGYLILLAPGLSLKPAAGRSLRLEEGDTLHEISAGWDPGTAVVDESGEELQKLLKNPTPAWVNEVQLNAIGTDLKLETPILVRISLPKGAELRSGRFGAQALVLKKEGSWWETYVTLPCSHPGPTISLNLLAVREGQSARFRVSTKADLVDSAVCIEGEWRRFDGLPPTCASRLERSRCRFFFYGTKVPGPREWAILEGDLIAQTPRNGTFLLDPLYGYGAKLTLKPGPYNSSEGSKRTLITSVPNQGTIRSFAVQGNRWTLTPARRLVGDDRFDLVFWDGSDTIALLNGDEIAFDEGVMWRGTLPNLFTGREELAVGLAFEGAFLGAWRSEGFRPLLEPDGAAQLAGLLRWFHWPILHRKWAAEARALALEHFPQFVQAWLFDNSVAGCPTLQLSDDSGWHACLRQLFRGASVPDQTLAATWHHLVKANTVRYGKQTLRQVWRRLVEVSPVLALKIIQSAGLRKPELQAALEMVTEGAALDDIALQAARDMGSDDKAFPLGLCKRATGKQPLSDLDQANLALAYQIRPFSRLFVAHYMQSKLLKK